MREISPASPTVGLSAIMRAERRSVEDQSGLDSRATFTGRTIRQNVRGLYDQKTVADAALELTVPKGIDPELLQPHRFHAAFLDAFDKVAEDAKTNERGDAAHATLARINAAMEQCRSNIASLNQV